MDSDPFQDIEMEIQKEITFDHVVHLCHICDGEFDQETLEKHILECQIEKKPIIINSNEIADTNNIHSENPPPNDDSLNIDNIEAQQKQNKNSYIQFLIQKGQCTHCNKTFGRAIDLKRHMSSVHEVYIENIETEQNEIENTNSSMLAKNDLKRLNNSVLEGLEAGQIVKKPLILPSYKNPTMKNKKQNVDNEKSEEMPKTTLKFKISSQNKGSVTLTGFF